MKSLAFLWIIIIVFMCCCNNTSHSEAKAISIFNIYDYDTLRLLINRDLKDVLLYSYPQDVQLRDTIFESEDGSTWKGIVFYKKTERILFVESSSDKEIIKRITLLSKSIKGPSDIHVGSVFNDIKQYLSHDIPSYPDGYFGLKYILDKHMTIFFDIGEDSNLSTGNVQFETIPNYIIVDQILIE